MQTTLTRRAQSLLPKHAGDVAHSIQLIAAYAAKNPGLEYGNYASGYADKAGRAAYFAEARQITKALHRVKAAVRDAAYAGVTDADIEQASKQAFGGRLTVTSEGVDYCAGQYWPTEYRNACAAVLESAVSIARLAA